MPPPAARLAAPPRACDTANPPAAIAPAPPAADGRRPTKPPMLPGDAPPDARELPCPELVNSAPLSADPQPAAKALAKATPSETWKSRVVCFPMLYVSHEI